jgi:hypothetical protein
LVTSVLVGIRLAVGWRRRGFAVFTGTMVAVGVVSICFSDLLALSHGRGFSAKLSPNGGFSCSLDDGSVDWIGVMV